MTTTRRVWFDSNDWIDMGQQSSRHRRFPGLRIVFGRRQGVVMTLLMHDALYGQKIDRPPPTPGGRSV